LNDYFEELKRRKVFQVAIAYVVGAWILTQIAAVSAMLTQVRFRVRSGSQFS
jgi:hypothetical protein